MNEEELTKSANQKAAALFIAACGLSLMAFYVVMQDYSKARETIEVHGEKLITVEGVVLNNSERLKKQEASFDAQMRVYQSLDKAVTRLNTLIEAK